MGRATAVSRRRPARDPLVGVPALLRLTTRVARSRTGSGSACGTSGPAGDRALSPPPSPPSGLFVEDVESDGEPVLALNCDPMRWLGEGHAYGAALALVRDDGDAVSPGSRYLWL